MASGFRWGAVGLLFLAACGDSGDEGAGPAPAGGSKVSAEAVFNEAEVNDFHLTMAPADWDSIIADTMGDVYRHATLRWKDVTVEDIGVRPSGHATRFPGNQKMSLKLKFNEFVEKQKFMGLKTLKLDGVYEGTMMRERISYALFRARVPKAPRAAHCRLFVNGAYRGVYLAEERVTDDLIDDRTGAELGTLYRIMVEIPEAFADRGSNPASYMPRPFQPEMNVTDGDHSVLPRLVQTLNQRPAELGAVCDLENLVVFLAIEVAIVSRDGLLRDDGPPQNHYVYFGSGGRAEFIPWDLDQTWTRDRATLSLYHNFEKTRIASVVRQTPELDALFRQRLAEVLEGLTRPALLEARIDAIYQQIRPFVLEDPNKPISDSEFDQMPGYLKNVVRLRYDSLRAQLGLP